MSTLDNPNLDPVETFYVAEFSLTDPDTAVRLLGPNPKAGAEHLVDDYNRAEIENAEMEMRPVRRRFEVIAATTTFTRATPAASDRLAVGTRIRVTAFMPGDSHSPLSPAERKRIAFGEPVTGIITANNDLVSHGGYAVDLDVPGSAIGRRTFLPAEWITPVT